METNVKVARRFENGRIVYYKARASGAYWDKHWQKHYSAEAYDWAYKGELGWLEKPFSNYLPKEGRILEAGCGLGLHVSSLRSRGYDAEGVDWAPETVKFVKRIRPDVPIRLCDVARLDVPDGYYDAYISLGVMEHQKDGPEPFLNEANRVLSDHGVALISVPHINFVRRIKKSLGLYGDICGDLEFYQYAYSQGEMAAFIEKSGFKIVDRYYYDNYKGLKDEVPFVQFLLRAPMVGTFLGRVLRSRRMSISAFAHMILFVCQKESRR